MRDKSAYCLKIKQETFNAYGGVSCSICGHDDIRSLTVDHINGGGRKHREGTTNRGGYSFYLLLRREGYPKGYRVLCSNCNMAIGHHGFSSLEKHEDNCCIKCGEIVNNTFEFYKKHNICICEKCCINGSIAKNALKSKKESLKYKDMIIENYGGKCINCEETNPLFLTIDHINGGGHIDRQPGKNVGVAFYRQLIRENYPKENIQLLCYNCNCGIKAYKRIITKE